MMQLKFTDLEILSMCFKQTVNDLSLMRRQLGRQCRACAALLAQHTLEVCMQQ